MITPDPDEVQTLLQSALAALKRGDKDAARTLAEQAASLAPESEDPWLVLAALASPEESLAYIKKALQINPESKPAQQALEWTLKRQSDRSPAPKTEPSAARTHLSNRLAFLAETLPEPDPPPKPIHPPASPAISAETFQEPESPSEPIQLPASPAASAESLHEPEPQAESIHRTAGSAIPGDIQPSPPATTRKKFSLSPARIAILSLIGLAMIALLVSGLALGSGGVARLQQSISRLLNPVPTPQCIQPALKLGNAQLAIKSIAREVDGSLQIPAQSEDAYWVEGTTISYVFGLSPTKDNLALEGILKAGDPMTINWADCSTDEYVVKSVETEQSGDMTIFDQSTGGITVFVLPSVTSAGLVIRGERPGLQIDGTPLVIDPNAIQIDIEFLENVPQTDASSVIIGLIITNRGTSAITLTNNDNSLTPENGQEIFPLSVDPVLPQDIGPGANLTLYITFPSPQADSAVLRIFDVTLDYYFQ